MLQAKSLDDSSYEQILEAAMNKLPVLCPKWTDYNAHDPGITLIELFSWYEELQRFHLDQMTLPVKRKLLALLGEKPLKAKSANCIVDLSGPLENFPKGTRLYTEEGISFEIEDSIEIGKLSLDGIFLHNSKKNIDVKDLLQRRDASLQPFWYGEERVELLLEFSNIDSDLLSLYFLVEEEKEVKRNPYIDPKKSPRKLKWFWNDKEITPLLAETHSLCFSGFVKLPVERAEKGRLIISQEEDGCEDEALLTEIRINCCKALQKETKSKLFKYTVPAKKNVEKEICCALAKDSIVTIFIRTRTGFEQLLEAKEEITKLGKKITMDCSRAVEDGLENLLIVCTEAKELSKLFFSSNGLPNQEIPLPLGEEKPVGDFCLICDSPFGASLWQRTDDLYCASPKDKVFVYDEEKESLIFGDGFYGSIVPKGEGSILVCNLETSLCNKGNIPGGKVLHFKENTYFCSSAFGGEKEESQEEASIRFLKNFSNTNKCASAKDYERLAKKTPGLRVAMAKALPCFDPANPFGHTEKPVVQVVVVPYSHKERPLPDENFLKEVKEQLEKYRPICTMVGVLPPRYIEIELNIRLRCNKNLTEEIIKGFLKNYFSSLEIGQSVVKNELSIFLQKQMGIWKVERLEMGAKGSSCRKNSLGDILLPPDAIACLGKISIEIR